MLNEIATYGGTYGGWACAIVAGFVAASNYAALRTERAQADNLYRRISVARQGLRDIICRATPKAKGAELDMAAMAGTALETIANIAREETAGDK